MCCGCCPSHRLHFISERESPCSATATIWCSVSPPTMTQCPTSTSLPAVLNVRWGAWLPLVKEKGDLKLSPTLVPGWFRTKNVASTSHSSAGCGEESQNFVNWPS